MKEQFETHLAEGGSNLSGGQKQRLSIARAVVKNPDIYVFDDSFSALDYKTDATLRRRLKEVTGDATVLIVAQRVGTIMDADQIIVLDQGEIVGRGTHDQLMESNDIYREIANSQLNSQSLTEE
ncbi:ABC transporter, ATP-binding/permease protein [Streptococcus sp. DD13]|nr:ABC transporter, ATP-binding/permease protein [Streptococcus sp. DD13]